MPGMTALSLAAGTRVKKRLFPAVAVPGTEKIPVALIASAKVTIATATTTAYDFGTPNDIDLRNIPGFTPGDRIAIAFSASTGGTTDSLTFSVQDAPDSSGSIGTPVTADTTGTLAMGTSDGFTVVTVKTDPARPWLRCRVTSTGATDTFVTHCLVMGVQGDVKVTADVYALVSSDNGLSGVGAADNSLEGQRKVLKYPTGTVITAAERDAHFPLATVPGALSPTGGAAAGGTVVTITGTNLTGVIDVTFAGASGTALTIDSATQIRVTTPAHAAGAVDVVIVDDSVEITKTSAFTYS